MNRRQWLRKYPPPPQPPAGMIWARVDGQTVLVPADEATLASQYRMGNYDRYPREIRDRIKATNKRA